jgi:Phosphate-induced protein 1 conserved region
MSYHGGPTQQTVAAYTIFWSPHGTISSSYRTLTNRYFQDIGGSGFYNIVPQYPGLTDTQNVSTWGGTWIDTNPYPAGEGTAVTPLSHTDIQAEVTRALDLNSSWNPAGLGRTYFVYTEPGIESCIDPTASFANLSCTPGVFSAAPMKYCAYHSAFETINNFAIYANMPYGETWPGMCRAFGTSPNGDIAADGEISMSSHEHFEAVTDPLFDAWYDSDSSGEIGDKCAVQYGSIMPDGHNLTLNGHPYITQLEWSNAANDGVNPFSGCVISSRAPQKWGDRACNGTADPLDSLKGLETDVGIPVNQSFPGCPDFGSSVIVNGVTLKWGDGDGNGQRPRQHLV